MMEMMLSIADVEELMEWVVFVGQKPCVALDKRLKGDFVVDILLQKIWELVGLCVRKARK